MKTTSLLNRKYHCQLIGFCTQHNFTAHLGRRCTMKCTWVWWLEPSGLPPEPGLSNWIPSSRCAVFRFSVFLPIFGFFQRFRRSALSFFCRFFLGVSVFFSVFFRIFSDFFSDYFQIFLARFFGQIFLKSTKLKFRFWGSGDVIESATEILVWCSAD